MWFSGSSMCLLAAARASTRIFCSGLRLYCTKQVKEKGLDEVYEKIDLPLAPVLADMERVGVRVDPKVLDKMSQSMEKEVRRLEKEIWKLAGSEFNVNSPTQLAEILVRQVESADQRRNAGRQSHVRRLRMCWKS